MRRNEGGQEGNGKRGGRGTHVSTEKKPNSSSAKIN